MCGASVASFGRGCMGEFALAATHQIHIPGRLVPHPCQLGFSVTGRCVARRSTQHTEINKMKSYAFWCLHWCLSIPKRTEPGAKYIQNKSGTCRHITSVSSTDCNGANVVLTATGPANVDLPCLCLSGMAHLIWLRQKLYDIFCICCPAYIGCAFRQCLND